MTSLTSGRLSWSRGLGFVPCDLFTVETDRHARRAALFFEATAIEVPDANCRPSKLSHDLRELAICTRGTLPLWHLETIEPRVAAHAL